MKTASIRDVRHLLGGIAERVVNGKEVAIPKHRRTVARMLPASSKKLIAAPMPDIAGRLQKVFGRKIISDKAIRAVTI